MADLTTIFHQLQRQLFPALTAELGPLSALDQQFCEVMALTDLGRFPRRYEWCGNGCPPCPRTWLAHAFIAKSVYQFPTTGALIDALKSRPLLRQLCGWESAGEIPSEPTFSRAFAAFAHDQVAPANPRTDRQNPRRHQAGGPCQPRRHRHQGPRTAGGQTRPRRSGPSGAKSARPRRPNAWHSSQRAHWPKIWRTCPSVVTWDANATARGIRKAGSVTNGIWTPWTAISRSARF